MHDDDDDIDEAARRREMYEQLCGTPEQRDAEAREMAERAAQIQRDETLAWAREMAAGREERLRREAWAENTGHTRIKPEPAGPTDELGRPLADPRYRLSADVVTKSYGAPVASIPATASYGWASYVERQLKKHDRAMTKAIAAVLVAEEKQREKTDAEIMAKLDTLTAQIDELRARLDKLEAAGKTAPIRLAG